MSAIRRGVARLALFVLAAATILLGVAAVRALLWRPVAVERPAAVSIQLPAAELAAKLAGAVQHVTVSDPDAVDPGPLAAFRTWLREAFPLTHSALTAEDVPPGSLLFTWAGRDSALAPAVLLAHQDTVPAESDGWTHAPFEGVVADGFVWGRGTLDDKGDLVAILEAVERLVADGFRPRRTVILAFGHDEEVGGKGAQAVAALLAARGVRAHVVLDEGMFVGEGLVPGVRPPVAVIGIAEKGVLTLELTARAEGGHSSAPAHDTAIGILARAIERLDASPMPARLDDSGGLLLRNVGPELPFGQRLALANLWLFRGVLDRVLSRTPATNALIRTTTAVTMFQAGDRANVLPPVAKATVNFRLLPGDSIEAVVAHVRQVVADDRIAISPVSDVSLEATPLSSTESAAWQTLVRSVREVFPDALVVPSIFVARADARYYSAIATDIYRFAPIRIGPADVARFHGVNERLSVDGFADMVRFHLRFLKNVAE